MIVPFSYVIAFRGASDRWGHSRSPERRIAPLFSFLAKAIVWQHFGNLHLESHEPPMNGQRKSTFSPGIGALIFNPANALALSLVGYYCMAGLANVYLPDSNLGGILIRGLIGSFVLVALARCFRHRRKIRGAHLYPAVIFLMLYFLRMYENAFIAQIDLPPSNVVAFLTFLISLLLPAFALTLVSGQIDDNQFDKAMLILLVVFLVSLFMNREELLSSFERRLMLDKINPISMAITAFAFTLYHLLRFRKSTAMKIQSAIVVPLMLLIILYARSRGVYIAGAATIIIYGLCLRGTRRLAYMMGTGLFVLAAATWLAGDVLEIIIGSLERILSGDDLSTNFRQEAAFGGWGQFQLDPVIGRYIIELSTQYYVHNMYLESLMAVGVVGTMFLLLHFIIVLRGAVGIIRSPHSTFVARFSGALFIFMAIIGASSSTIYLASEFWITSFVVIAFWYGKIGVRRTSTRPAAKRRDVEFTSRHVDGAFR